MFDTYHALYRNEVSSDYVFEMAEHLDHVHFADTNRLPPGEGTVDWIGVMAALKQIGFAGYLTMEAGFNTRAVEPDRVARSALAYLRRRRVEALENDIGEYGAATAAIAGQLVCATGGVGSIPLTSLAKIVRRMRIRSLTDQLFDQAVLRKLDHAFS